MPTLNDAVARFTALTADPEPDGKTLWQTARQINEASRRARPDERDAALSRLKVSLDHGHPQVAGLAAITGGSLVEEGASPALLGPALLSRLTHILAAAVRFADRCVEAMGDDEPEDAAARDEAEDDGDGSRVVVAGRDVPEAVIEAAFRDDPGALQAYMALDPWCFSAVACLSRLPDLRATARRTRDLARLTAQLEAVGNSGGVAFLSKLLPVLDDELLLVLHPETGKGFRCRIGGVADNFQLHTLLMDALIAPAEPRAGGVLGRWMGGGNDGVSDGLPDGLPGARPKPSWVMVARGDGPQQADEPTAGAWDLYQWTALDGGGKLPGGGSGSPGDASAHWVWNEGMPADILAFEGTRVLLLGPPSYPRSWNTGRLFSALPAYVRVEETLAPQDVADWLSHMARAPRPATPS